MRIITPTDIEKAYATRDVDWRQVRQYMIEQLEEDDYLVLHLPETYVSKEGILRLGAMMYCHEVWIIRQIGPALCLKHRYRETPFECLF